MNTKNFLYILLTFMLIAIVYLVYLYNVDVGNRETYTSHINEYQPALYELECHEANGFEKLFRKCIGWDD